jgi:hypothetical protein
MFWSNESTRIENTVIIAYLHDLTPCSDIYFFLTDAGNRTHQVITTGSAFFQPKLPNWQTELSFRGQRERTVFNPFTPQALFDFLYFSLFTGVKSKSRERKK